MPHGENAWPVIPILRPWPLFLLVMLFTAVESVTPLHAAKRNIVLFVADDHGTDAGCYGNHVIQTPNWDYE